MIDDLISRQAVIDAVHHAIYEFFNVVEDDDESPITHKDVKLLELNKSICRRVKDLPAADVVDKERYARLLANAIIVSNALQEYQSADGERREDDKK